MYAVYPLAQHTCPFAVSVSPFFLEPSPRPTVEEKEKLGLPAAEDGGDIDRVLSFEMVDMICFNVLWHNENKTHRMSIGRCYQMLSMLVGRGGEH